MSLTPLGRLCLPDVQALPSLPFGPLHLVPLVRKRAVGELGLCPMYGAQHQTIAHVDHPRLCPHGTLVDLDEHGDTRFAYGTQLLAVRTRGIQPPIVAKLRAPLGRRDHAAGLRMAPLILALEGMMLRTWDVDADAWHRWNASRRELTYAPPRSHVAAAEAALRTFERDTAQCGMLLYAADSLLSAIVAPCAEVYAALHDALVRDLLAGVIQWYLTRADVPEVRPFVAALVGRAIRDLDDLSEALAVARRPWPTAVAAVSEGLVPVAVEVRSSQRVGRFVLRRFVSQLAVSSTNVLGEAVHREDGALAWLMLHRLSDAQTHRATRLDALAAVHWRPSQLVRRSGWGDTLSSVERSLRRDGFMTVLDVMGPKVPRRA